MVLLQGERLPQCIKDVRAYVHAVATEFGLMVHGFAAIRNQHFVGEVRVPSTRLQDQELHCDEKRYSVFIPTGPRSFGVVGADGNIQQLDVDAGEPHP